MRFCFVADNRDRENWGCRATSIALKNAVAEQHEIVSSIYGQMTFNYNRPLYEGQHPRLSFSEQIWRSIPYVRRFKRAENADFISDDVEKSLSSFLAVFKKYDPLNEIYEKISNCDGVVLNGEGSFIYTTPYRYDLAFYLFILALAQHLGKKTYLLNAMFSPAPDGGENSWMLSQSTKILSRCDVVAARDPLSFAFCRKNICSRVEYVPDALFLWRKFEKFFDVCQHYPLAGIPFPEFDEFWQSFDFHKEYICVSGGSLAARDPENAVQGYIHLVTVLKKIFPNIIIVSTCAGDFFLERVAKATGSAYIPVQTNILFGLSILGNAKILVSGRWHPSIMASLSGTPCVFMKGNSHKCLALQHMLKYTYPHEYSAVPSPSEVGDIAREVEQLLLKEPKERHRIRDVSIDLSREISLAIKRIV